MVGRQCSANDSYRFGFNGKENDNEVKTYGAQINYGLRIEDSRLGRFFSLDPLLTKYPELSPFQFASNSPVWAVDLDGGESKIVIRETKADGSVVITSETNYNVEKRLIITTSPTTHIPNITEVVDDQRGPLGAGTYTITKSSDGTFSESWTPDPGNSVRPFFMTGISQTRWISDDGKFHGLETRLEGRLIEKMTEEALILLGFEAIPVLRDVIVLETDDANFKGKFATLNSSALKKYAEGWSSQRFSSPHQSTQAQGSGELENIGLELKSYDGGKSSTDDIPNHIGLVKSSFIAHLVETANALLGDNTGLINAKKLKEHLENKRE